MCGKEGFVRKLTGTLAAAALACAPFPAAARPAQAEPAPPTAPADGALDGLWQGKIGGESVMACFDASIGSFYRIADKKLVMLWAEAPLRFAERDEREPGNPRWQLRLKGPDRAGGRRTHGGDAQPLTLTRLSFAPEAGSEGDLPGTPCTSLAYHRARLEPLAVRERPDRLGSAQFVRIEAAPPSYPDAVSLRSFRLPAASPAVAAVNAILARAIDLRGPGESAWSLCLAWAGNSGGDFHLALEPVRIGRRFLAATESRDESCGGNHPNFALYPRLFDLVQGREIAIREWLHPRALAADRPDAAGAASDGEPNSLPLSQALSRRLLARAQKREDDCAGAMEGVTWWTIAVDRTGFRFSPQLGHAVRACGEDVLLPFAAAAPFLNARGKATLAALRADPAAFAPEP
jgi:hypothetical protein